MSAWHHYPPLSPFAPLSHAGPDAARGGSGDPAPNHLDRLATRRAHAKLGWLAHAGVYVAVNLLLAVVALAQGRHWAAYPALGWGVGLAIHGIAVFVATGGGGWQSRMVAREREQLEREQQRAAS